MRSKCRSSYLEILLNRSVGHAAVIIAYWSSLLLLDVSSLIDELNSTWTSGLRRDVLMNLTYGNIPLRTLIAQKLGLKGLKGPVSLVSPI